MDWDDFKHFLAVARGGSLTAAARTLKSSPATVGRRVAALERKLGTKLFDRRQSGYSLTEGGEAIRIKAEDMEDAIISAEREALGRDLRVTGRVRVTASDDIATYVIAPSLAQFRRLYPGIMLEIIARMDLINLSRSEADIALRGVPPTSGDVVVRPAGIWPYGLYASKVYCEANGLEPGQVDFSRVAIITWTEQYAHLRGGPWFAEHARGAPVALASRIRHWSTSAHARQGSVWPYFPAGSQTATAISFVCCAQRRSCRSNCWSSCIAIWPARRGCARSWSFWLILRRNDELNHWQVLLSFSGSQLWPLK
jgi:DNA-binding transcriptional LysR family regulator